MSKNTCRPAFPNSVVEKKKPYFGHGELGGALKPERGVAPPVEPGEARRRPQEKHERDNKREEPDPAHQLRRLAPVSSEGQLGKGEVLYPGVGWDEDGLVDGEEGEEGGEDEDKEARVEAPLPQRPLHLGREEEVEGGRHEDGHHQRASQGQPARLTRQSLRACA